MPSFEKPDKPEINFDAVKTSLHEIIRAGANLTFDPDKITDEQIATGKDNLIKAVLAEYTRIEGKQYRYHPASYAIGDRSNLAMSIDYLVTHLGMGEQALASKRKRDADEQRQYRIENQSRFDEDARIRQGHKARQDDIIAARIQEVATLREQAEPNIKEIAQKVIAFLQAEQPDMDALSMVEQLERAFNSVGEDALGIKDVTKEYLENRTPKSDGSYKQELIMDVTLIISHDPSIPSPPKRENPGFFGRLSNRLFRKE